MPRQARLDAPDALHHVMVRGLERRVLFRDDQDRAECVARLAALAEAGAWTVYAWAVPPTHAHLLVRPLPRSMRSLVTPSCGGRSTAVASGVGHLFQNRYKSVVMEEEPYLLELVRYLPLNPLLTLDQDLFSSPERGHVGRLLVTAARRYSNKTH